MSAKWVMKLSIYTAIIRKISPKEKFMNQYRIFAAITVLVFASLSCQATVDGGSDGVEELPPAQDSTVQPDGADPTEEPAANSTTGGSNTSTSSGFPTTEDAFNVVELGDDSLIFYTKLSAEDAMEFYRDVYSSMGYTEREILTVVTEVTFSMVFDGDPSGKAVVIQSVDLGDGSRTIAIRLEGV
jgi:hypothetical protein